MVEEVHSRTRLLGKKERVRKYKGGFRRFRRKNGGRNKKTGKAR